MPCFVIQEHHVRTHHFDFRLDKDGVFKSWAVPKGLHGELNVKSLAVQAEDDGVSFGDSEGQINVYLIRLKKHERRQEAENQPVGLILCPSKKRQHAELMLRSGPHKMQVSTYLTQLPPKRVLAGRLKIYSRLLE